MLTREETVQLARKYADGGYLCSESVLKALAESFGIKNELIPRIATGFGGGMGRSGEVCGAVSGAFMGLSLLYGRDTPGKPGPRRPYWYTTAAAAAFRKRHGTLRCHELLKLDLNNPADYKTYSEQKMWTTNCCEYIEAAAGIAYDVASEEAKSKEGKK